MAQKIRAADFVIAFSSDIAFASHSEAGSAYFGGSVSETFFQV